MSNIPVTSLFEVISGNDLELNKLDYDNKGVNFVSRNRNNNGVVAKVKRIKDISPCPAGTISVALSSSSTMFSYLQDDEYYTAYHVACLKPRIEMTKNQLLFYCTCLTANRYKYNWGRQADKTIGKILIPEITDIPDWVNEIKIKDLSYYQKKYLDINLDLFSVHWHEFKLYPELFEMEPGKYVSSLEYHKGKTPYVSSSDSNNGVGMWTDMEPMFGGNQLTIGKVYCSAYYQEDPFCATSDCTVLTPKFPMNKYSGLFIATVLNQNRFKWNYGRQIRLNNCQDLTAYLPAIQIGEFDYKPDIQFMENFIKTLPFSMEL
jgi:hypothetical protein